MPGRKHVVAPCSSRHCSSVMSHGLLLVPKRPHRNCPKSLVTVARAMWRSQIFV